MGAYYMDSSALVKRYANETGSLWIRSRQAPQAGHDLFTHDCTRAPRSCNKSSRKARRYHPSYFVVRLHVPSQSGSGGLAFNNLQRSI